MILPPLSTLLIREQQRHYTEVAAISKFHAFMTAFEEDGGTIGGVPYKLSGISVEDCVASFRGEHGDYFYSPENDIKNPAPFGSQVKQNRDFPDYPIAV